MTSAFALLVMWFQDVSTGDQINLNADTCQDASRSYLISCIAIAAVAAILAVLLKRFWDSRQTWSPGIRFGLSITLAFVVSSALVAWNPVKPQYFLDCIEDLQYSRFIYMANIAAVPKGLVLGGLVSIVLYLLITILLGLLIGRRKR
jgi:hypothetical protein